MALQSWDDQYCKEVESIENLVEEASSSGASGKEQDKIISELLRKTEHIKGVKKSFGLEIKMVKDKNIKTEYDHKLKSYDTRVAAVVTKIEMLKGQNEKKELMVGKGGYSKVEGKDNDELLQEASKIQDETMNSLARTKNLVEASKEIGQTTLEVLQKQREQIAEIDNEISVMDGNLKRAQVLVKGFSKRMAGDRIIQAFATINLIILVVVIIYVVVTGKSLAATNSSDPADPSTGVDDTSTDDAVAADYATSTTSTMNHKTAEAFVKYLRS
jgi:hypothetical protein